MFRRLNLTALVGLFVVVLMSGAQAVPNPMNLVSDLGVEEESTTEPAPEACSDEPAGSEEEDAEAADVEGDAAELEDTEAGDEHADEDSTCEEEGTGGSSVADEDGDGDEETDAETDGSDGEASAAQAKKVVQNHGAAVRIAAHCDVPGKLHGELVSSIAKDKEATPEQAESACEAAMASAGASSRGVDKGERSDKGPRGARGRGSEARTQKRDAGGSSAKNTESRGTGKGDEKKVGSGKPAGAGKPAGVGKPADAGAGKGRSKR